MLWFAAHLDNKFLTRVHCVHNSEAILAYIAMAQCNPTCHTMSRKFFSVRYFSATL